MNVDIYRECLENARQATIEKLAEDGRLVSAASPGEVLSSEDPRVPVTLKRPEGWERAKRLGWVAARPAIALGSGMALGFGASHGVGSAYKAITGKSISPETLKAVGIGAGSLGAVGTQFLLNKAVPRAIERAEAGYDDY